MANPSRLDKIQITANTNSGTATKVNVQEANGEVNTQDINTAFNKNFGLNGGDVVGATTLLNQYATTPIDWTATAFDSGQVVFYGGKQWIAKIATVAGDVPAVSSKWEEITFEALANKTVTVDSVPTDGSNNAVSSNGVFDALATKAPISSVHNPVTIGTANGLSLSTQVLSLGLASSGVTGALSGTDWNNFNNKQPAITGLTTNYLPKWNGGMFENSIINESSGVVKLEKSVEGIADLLVINNANDQTGVVDGVRMKIGAMYIESYSTHNSPNNTLTIGFLTNKTLSILQSGRMLINKTDDDLTNQLQVAGTISASPATTANQVVIKSQLDAVVASSGSYTPTVSASTNCVNPGALPSTYTKNGNTVTLRLNVLAANFTAANTFTRITVNLPVNRTLNDVKNIGCGSGHNTLGDYWAAIAQTGANNNTVLVSFRTPSTSTGNITLFVQYDITQ